MSRSFTIIKIEKTSGSKLQYSGGRFMGESPSQVSRKVFSHANRHCRTKCNSITIRETSQNSAKKEYTYRVKKVKDETTVNLGKSEVVFGFKTKTKSLN